MLIHTLITLITSTLTIGAPDLCADPYLNAAGEPITDSAGRTLSRFCEWEGADAPRLETNLCCEIDNDVAKCTLANLRGYCSTGTRAWCEYGEIDSATGVATCYQVFPEACDQPGLCVQAPAGAPEEDFTVLCCHLGNCTPADTYEETVNCEGSFVICDYGMTNQDGTVECFE